MKAVTGFEDERFALVAIDVQKKFSESTEGLRMSTPRMLRTLNKAIELFRSTGNPVIYVMYTGEMYDGHPGIDADGDEFADGLTPPKEGDPIVCKNGMNAFTGSGLQDVLDDLGCDSILLGGIVSHCCIAATYFGAFDLGYSSYILKDGTAATERENTEAVERICRTLTIEDMERNQGFRSRRP